PFTIPSAHIAIASKTAQLYEKIAPQERRLQRDLALARELQVRLLPQTRPKLPNLEVAARFVPARAIGGDLYDFVDYSLSRLGITIGDVSGKGAPAAIYAALVSGILRSHAPIEPAPAEMLSAINNSLGERRIDAQFVSLIYAVWDDSNRTLQVANSGLPRPIYCHNGKLERIEATGLPLGLFDEAEYDEFTFKAKPGDLFVLFSDGKLAARDRTGVPAGRPPAFAYRKTGRVRAASILSCDSVPITALAERYGTPLYVYSASTIRERLRAFDRAFRGVPHTICYSVKANSNLAILRLLH